MADMVLVQHSYAKSSKASENKNNERVSSFFPLHHDYCNKRFFEKKRKRSFSSPTGKTPTQETKQRVHSVLETKHHSWTTAEKECVLSFMQTNRIDDAVTENKYWEKCASHLHSLFPDKIRTGSSCRTMSKRLQIDPNFYGSLSMEHAVSLEQPSSLEHPVSLEQPVFMKQTRTGEAQTESAIPFSHISLAIPCERKSVDEIPLKEGSVGAHYIHDSAIRRLQNPMCISLEEKGVIIDTVMQGDTADIASAILKIPCLHDTLKVMILHDIEEDARKSASRKHSVLKSGNFTDLNSFSWDRILQEMVEKQRLLTEVLLSVAMPSSRIGSSKATESLVPMLGCVYAILMKARFHELSAVQRVLSLALANEHTHQKVYDRLQPLGITLSHSGLSKVLDLVSGHFNAELIDSVKRGDKFRIVGDNINFEIGVTHERKSSGKSRHMEHWFGSAAIIQIVRFDELCAGSPQCNLLELSWHSFVPNNEDFTALLGDYTLLIARVLAKFIPAFKFCESTVNKHIIGQFSEELARKNKVIPLPVVAKNEQKYADVVDILDQYENIIQKTSEEANIPISSVHIGGDQLTRERFSGAKRLRAAALTESEKFGHLKPITFELFHLQMAFLTLFYQVLYNTSCTDPETLHSQKIRLNRKDANGNDVKNHFDHCKELAVSFTNAYIVEAACQFFEMVDVNSLPNVDIPVTECSTDDEIKKWLLEILTPFIETFVWGPTKQYLDTEHEEIGYRLIYIQLPDGRLQQYQLPLTESKKEPDHMYQYGQIVLELGLLFMQLNDVIKVPDRDRLIRTLSYLMIVFKGHNTRSKYALEILRFLCQQKSLLSQKAAFESCFGLFVNTKGKINSHIPADQQMEHLVRLTKGHLKAMGSNVSDKTILKRSSALFGIQEISENYDIQTGVITRAKKHKSKSSILDEQQIINDLRVSKPFQKSPGRLFKSLAKTPKNPVIKLSKADLRLWIDTHKVNLFYSLGT